MARDAELDRLKAAQDTAFQRQQSAHSAMQSAWERRDSATAAMNKAYGVKERLKQDLDRTWQDFQATKSRLGPQIDRLKSMQESSYQDMRKAFENASWAHSHRDGAGAKSYAEEGHRHKADSQRHVVARRELVDQIRAARAVNDGVKHSYHAAKLEYEQCRQRFESVKAEHVRLSAEFKRVKAEHAAAKQAFGSRLATVKAASSKRREDRKAVAAQAGVPHQYRDNVWIRTDAAGNTNIYFGGVGSPDGPGHGHYVLSSMGKVTYKRDPFDAHGAQNVVRDERLEQRLSRIALEAYHRDRSSTGPRGVQYDDGTVTVKVKSGYNRKTGSVATDVIVVDRAANPNEHLHLVLSEHDGAILFKEWRVNRS